MTKIIEVNESTTLGISIESNQISFELWKKCFSYGGIALLGKTRFSFKDAAEMQSVMAKMVEQSIFDIWCWSDGEAAIGDLSIIRNREGASLSFDYGEETLTEVKRFLKAHQFGKPERPEVMDWDVLVFDDGSEGIARITYGKVAVWDEGKGFRGVAKWPELNFLTKHYRNGELIWEIEK